MLSFCPQPFCSLIQIHGHNRARQRDKLGHILEEFATLQDEVRVSVPPTFPSSLPPPVTPQRLLSIPQGREDGRCPAQHAGEAGAPETASGLPGNMDPVPQPTHHDPVPAERL